MLMVLTPITRSCFLILYDGDIASCIEEVQVRIQQTLYPIDCAETGELYYFYKKGNKTLTFP